jgi:arylsulfatase A-like enzyme
MDVHDPYLPPQPYRSRFSSQAEPGGLINWQLHVPDNITAEQLQSEIDAYDGAIAYVDDQLDNLIRELRRRRTSRELMVIVTSDHGEEFKEHGNLLHGHSLYRETIQVPLIIWHPGKVPAGVRVSTPVTNAAVPATIAELFRSPNPFPRTPLQRLWETPEAVPLRYPLAELKHRPWIANRYPVQHGSIRSVTARAWHCIDHEKTGLEVYDRQNDPSETSNLADKPGMESIVNECRKLLEAALNGAPAGHQSN